MKTHLKAFLQNPIIKEILEPDKTPSPSQATPSSTLDLKKIQDTLSQLSKAVESLKSSSISKPKQKASTQNLHTSGPTHTHFPCTFAAIARARPPNPSLVVDLAHLSISQKDWVKPTFLCRTLNEGLASISSPQVQLATVRWTAKGNLVVTGGPSATPHSLQLAAPHISNILHTSLSLPSSTSISQPRANAKWSKILLNGVPTGVSDDLGSEGPASPDLCHTILVQTNPFYASLTITQKPSWVCPPSFYSPNSVSSLSFAFEDPDRTKLKLILTERYLYLFGHRVQVKKWKYWQPKSKDNSKSNTTKHTQDGDKPDEEDIKITLTPATISTPLPIMSTQPTRMSRRKPKPPHPFEA